MVSILLFFRMLLKQIWFLACTIFRFSTTTSARTLPECKETNIEELCTKSWETHESFLMQDFQYEPNYDIQVFKNTKLSKISRSHEDHQCTWQTGHKYNSTCPHHYVINYDPNRRPTTLLEAKCNCNGHMNCLNGDEGSRCVPVKYYTHVLRKSGCDGHYYTYTKTVEPITVGCTCAYMKENHNS